MRRMLRDAERERCHYLQDVRNLRRGVQRHVAAEGLRQCDDCTGFHGHRDEALLDVALLYDVRRFVHRLLAVTLVVLDNEGPGV